MGKYLMTRLCMYRTHSPLLSLGSPGHLVGCFNLFSSHIFVNSVLSVNVIKVFPSLNRQQILLYFSLETILMVFSLNIMFVFFICLLDNTVWYSRQCHPLDTLIQDSSGVDPGFFWSWCTNQSKLSVTKAGHASVTRTKNTLNRVCCLRFSCPERPHFLLRRSECKSLGHRRGDRGVKRQDQRPKLWREDHRRAKWHELF